MKFLQELLVEMNALQQAELEAQKELSDSGLTDMEKNKAILAKRTKDKQKQITNMSQSDDPIDRQIVALRRQIAVLLQKKQAKATADATRV